MLVPDVGVAESKRTKNAVCVPVPRESPELAAVTLAAPLALIFPEPKT